LQKKSFSKKINDLDLNGQKKEKLAPKLSNVATTKLEKQTTKANDSPDARLKHPRDTRQLQRIRKTFFA
jgi:hypothetical protein